MMIKQGITLFIQTQKQKQLLIKLTLMMYLIQSVILIPLGKGSSWIIESVIIIILIFQSVIP